MGNQDRRTELETDLPEQASSQGEAQHLLEFACRHEQGGSHEMGHRLGLCREGCTTGTG